MAFGATVTTASVLDVANRKRQRDATVFAVERLSHFWHEYPLTRKGV